MTSTVTAPWHRQSWVKVGPPYIDDDDYKVQLWMCKECGDQRVLFVWAKPRYYWHGRRKGVDHR